MEKFLTPAWFMMVKDKLHSLGDLHLSPAMQQLHLNVQVHNTPKEAGSFYIKDAMVVEGMDSTAKSTVLVSKETLTELFTQPSSHLLIQYFLQGDIQITGDLSQLMNLQTSQPSNELQALLTDILSNTKY